MNRENRPIPAKDYLSEIYNKYVKLVESSEALVKKIEDKLNTIDINKKNEEEKDSDDIVVLTPRPSGRVDLPSNSQINNIIDD